MVETGSVKESMRLADLSRRPPTEKVVPNPEPSPESGRPAAAPVDPDGPLRSRSGHRRDRSRQLPRGTETTPTDNALLLVDSDLKPIYTSAATFSILTYSSESPSAANHAALIQDRIRSVLHPGRSIATPRQTYFLSGRRRYVCRAFALELQSGVARRPILAVLLERPSRAPIAVAEICDRFHLSPRERETVQHIIRGLTTKEVAERMNVSPNTVKQFVRLIMSKMRVTTRSGVVGKFIGA